VSLFVSLGGDLKDGAARGAIGIDAPKTSIRLSVVVAAVPVQSVVLSATPVEEDLVVDACVLIDML
jgi:hypothetical protein